MLDLCISILEFKLGEDILYKGVIDDLCISILEFKSI